MSTHSHGGGHHHHGHDHAPQTYNKAFIISIIANGLFVVIQIVFAYLSNSTSLLADAFHNLGDVLGLIMAWMATVLMKRAPTMKATYGLKKNIHSFCFGQWNFTRFYLWNYCHRRCL